MAMTLPTAEELFGETVRKVSSTPQEWLKFLNTASRVYQYTFDAQLMIYAQRPNAIGCTSFEKWKQMNHYVKRGTQGIALIVRNGENRKLRYVYDYSDTGVASNIPETDIRKPYIWSLGEDGQEDLCDYINNKYNIRPQNKDLGLVLKQLIEETVNDVIDDEISEILKEKQGSYLEDLDIDTIRKEYRELFIHSAWYMLLRRCGIEPGDYMYLEDFRAITDFNNINVISCLGTPVSEQCSFVLKDISRYLWQKNLQKNRAESIVQSNQREYNKDNKTQEQKRGVNRNDVDIHKEGGRTAVSGSGIKGSSEGIHREIRSNESRLSGAASEIKVYGDDDDRGNQSTYDRHSETGRGENGRTDARTDEDSRSNRGTEGSRSDEVGRTRKQLQTAGGGDNQRRDYIQLSLFPENPQEQAEYGTAAGNTPAAVFAFPDNYIDECLRTGGNNELSLEYVLLDLAQENPQKILAKDLKENWKGGKGLAMPDGIKVSVWYNEEGISFRRGNGARKNPERLLSWDAQFLTDFLIFLNQFFQVFGGQVGVRLVTFSFLHRFKSAFVFVQIGAENNVGEHLQETTVRVVGKSFGTGSFGQSLNRFVVQTEVQNGVHHARHGNAGAGTNREQQRVFGIGKFFAHDFFNAGNGGFNLVFQVGRIGFVVGIVVGADFSRNCKSGRNGQTDDVHFRQVGTLTAQEVSHGGIAFGLAVSKCIYPFTHGNS